ncbi:MAG: tetratricopeptide repeat protein [Phycisphaerales bacterium]
MPISAAAFVFTWLIASATADDPTWARDIAPILFEHCASCHRPGEVSPFPLLTVDDATKRARQIARVTSSRLMPPWLAEPSDPPFVGARRLTDAQIELLSRWAEAGAPAGDLAAAPVAPTFTPGWQLGEPDLVVTMPTAYVLPPEGTDRYRNFVIPIPVEAMKYVCAVELRPGNPRVVHHASIKIDRSDSSRRLDELDAELGFSEMSQGEATYPDGHFIGWTPGRTPTRLPDGMAWRLYPESDLVLQLHLLPSGKEEPVQASVGFFFTELRPAWLPFVLRLGSKSIDIPADASDYEISDRFTLPIGLELHALAPHAHFLGRSVRSFATLPDGTTRPLLDIPHWNFSWQDEFRFSKPIHLPAGTTLEMRWSYDNSAANLRNPSHPPQRVRYGPGSFEEMCDLWLQVTPSGRADFEALRKAFVEKDIAMQRAGYEMRIAATPGDADAHVDLGLALVQQSDPAGALARFTKAVELAPAHVRGLFALGSLLAREKQAAAARARFEQVIALESGHAGALTQLAILDEADGDLRAALARLEAAVAARPKMFEARINLGRMLRLLGEDAGARVQYEAALALDRAATDVQRALAWLCATSPVDQARDGERALELAHALVDADSSNPLELDVLAAAQAECGRFRLATKTATRAADAARKRGAPAFAVEIDKRRDLYSQSQRFRAPASRPAGGGG